MMCLPAASPEVCKYDSDCKSGYSCVSNVCIKKCTAGSKGCACMTGYKCNPGLSCQNNKCTGGSDESGGECFMSFMTSSF